MGQEIIVDQLLCLRQLQALLEELQALLEELHDAKIHKRQIYVVD